MEIKNTAITATMVIQSLVKLLENENVDISSVKFKVGSESNGYESPEFELEKLIDLAYEGLEKIKQQATPEGFVLVPKEPTEDMTIYAIDNCEYDLEQSVMASIYKDMLKAAQEQSHD
ncbi:hypothetical protein I6M74_08160 [Acinetobacter bereziniae]|uniref:hypothetical protein n=1 Tax=Acinetobacter bereziniae TaxID=106648 RepID=UPI001901F050|nr:hypothetical protein [Acinetobacter bereziniae]MBJ8421872.1 hypothetical protein [Acinetobacter bereziniae]